MKNKLRLVLPNKKYLDTFTKGMEEFRRERTKPAESLLRIYKKPQDFSALKKFLDREHRGLNLEKGKVPQTVYWAMVGNKFVGILKLRHKLWQDPSASHIGYAVIPTERNKGYATEMLRFGIKKARTMGIQNLVMACNEKNLASKKVIENNGGINFKKIKSEGVYKLMFNIKS